MSQISLNGYSKNAFDKRLKQDFKNRVAADSAKPKLSKHENFISQLHDDTKLYAFLNTSPDKSWWDIGRQTPYYRHFNSKKINGTFLDGDNTPSRSLKALKDVEDKDNLESGIYAGISAISGASASAIGVATSHASSVAALAAGKAATFAIGGTALFNPLALIPLGLGVGGAMLVRKLWNKRHTEANNLTKSLQGAIKTSNQHEYWQQASKLEAYDSSNIPETIKTVINLYKFGNDSMVAKKGHSLLDTFINDNTKSSLSGFKEIEDEGNAYKTIKLSPDMSNIPDELGTIMNWDNMDALDNEAKNALQPIADNIDNDNFRNHLDSIEQEPMRLKKLLGFRMLVMKEIGASPEFSKEEQKLIAKSASSTNTSGIKKAIELFDNKYKENYHNALLLFQAKNSMASPIFTKITELLDKQVMKLSQEVSDKNIDNVPEFMEKVTKKYIQKLMVQLGLQSDLKMARTLEALRNVSMQKMAGVLNNFSSDSTTSELRKLSYKHASLDNLYPAVTTYEKKIRTASNQISEQAIRKIIDGKIKQSKNFTDRLILNSDSNFGKIRRWKKLPFFKRPLNPNSPAERELHNLINRN